MRYLDLSRSVLRVDGTYSDIRHGGEISGGDALWDFLMRRGKKSLMQEMRSS